MPSLLAHIFLGMILALVLGARRKSIVLFGSILPDIKIFLYLVATPVLGLSAANALIVPIHSPFGSMLLALFFAALLPKEEYRRNLLYLGLGVLGHFALDASIYPFYGIEHYLLLYPFSWSIYGIEASNYIFVFSVIGLLFLSILAYKTRKTGADIILEDTIV
jgi:hypothetical protein